MNRLTEYLVAGAAIVIIIGGLHQISSLVSVLLLSLLIAFMIVPFTEWLIRKHVPRWLSIILTFLVFFIGGILLSAAIGVSIIKLVNTLPAFGPRVKEITDWVTKFFTSIGIDISKIISVSNLNPDKVMNLATGFLSEVVGLAGHSLFVIILVVFILIELLGIKAGLVAGKHSKNIFLLRFNEISRDIKRYISLAALTGIINAAANVILLWILGVDFLVLWGAITFMFTFIPFIGFIVYVSLPLIYILLAFGWQKALIMWVGFVAINSIVEGVLKPIIMKGGLKISMLEVTLSFIFWAWAFGIVGGIVSIPLTMAIKKIAADIAGK
jgi:AI-2 transport protein TqsA